ncbi:MAG: cupin [SAR324 cluster bacterium]|nr:cupin [SAR324 cluster bacterium]MED5342661.1 cupin [SAR324 cluster bacterium]
MILQKNPFRVPTGDDKIIEEHFGKASQGGDQLSLARMEAPPRWTEPFQTPEFDEYTLVYSGKMQVEVDGLTHVLEAKQSILVKGGSRVRYSNPFDQPSHYCSVCIPAFSPETVNREED